MSDRAGQAAGRAALRAQLEACQRAAEESLARTGGHRMALDAMLRQLADELASVSVDGDSTLRSFQSALEGVRAGLQGIRAGVRDVSSNSVAELDAAFQRLASTTRQVTITLFGRTRAGKSTTMEALVSGDGRSIGKGRQHTTRVCTEYYWPTNQRTLRIVDTPGIEGFHGEDLARVAQEFIDETDHVFFVLSDDKASAGELEELGHIRTMHKGVTVLLNVKEADLDLLVERPELIFRGRTLEEHESRIAEYLRTHFGIAKPTILPLHARAAWEATRSTDPERRRALRTASRIVSVEERILEFVSAEALAARIRSPRDLLLSFIETLRRDLRPFHSSFQAIPRQFREQQRRLERVSRAVEERAVLRLRRLERRYRLAAAALPGVVDELVAAGKGGRSLQGRWNALLEETGITGAVAEFAAETLREFQAELQEDARQHAFDAGLHPADGLDDAFGRIDELHEQRNRRKHVRAGARAAAGAAAGALAVFAIVNLWNPAGWVVAAGSAAAGWAGERAAKAGADAWVGSTEEALRKERNAIVEKLQVQLVTHYETTHAQANAWLARLFRDFRGEVAEVATTVQKSCTALLGSTTRALQACDAIESEIRKSWVIQCAELAVPEVRLGQVVIERLAWDDRRPKLLVRRGRGCRGGALGPMLGRDGSRMAQLGQLLGGVRIGLVDGDASLEEQVAQALRPARVRAEDVRIDASNVAVVRCVASERRKVVGPDGNNARLAARLLGFTEIRLAGTERERPYA